MKWILILSVVGAFSMEGWARPHTTQGATRPVTEVSAKYPQTTISAQRPQTGVSVPHPTTKAAVYPQTTVQVQHPTTTVQINHPQTTVSVVHPQTETIVLHPQTPGEKSMPQTGQPRTFSQGGGASSVPSSQQATLMSDFKPKPAKDFTSGEKAHEMGGGSLALGNDTADQAAKDAMAASQIRSDQRNSVENADLKNNPSAALAGLDKIVTDRAKVQQKKQ